MRILKALRDALTQPDTSDAELYGYIAEEVASGFLRDGIWAKALTEAEFDQARAKAIYMKMAVASLKVEAYELQRQDAYHQKALSQANESRQRVLAENEAARKADLMARAFDLYDHGDYDEATEGLILLVEQQRDHRAAACLAAIFFYGLHSEGSDQEAAFAMAALAEESQNPSIRKFLADAMRASDEVRALSNYEFAAKQGDVEAKLQAKQLRAVLEHERKIPKRGLFDRF